jgi:hypothetical protein
MDLHGVFTFLLFSHVYVENSALGYETHLLHFNFSLSDAAISCWQHIYVNLKEAILPSA